MALLVGGTLGRAKLAWPPFLVGGVAAGLLLGWAVTARLVRRTRRQLVEAPTVVVWWDRKRNWRDRQAMALQLTSLGILAAFGCAFAALVGIGTGPFGVALGATLLTPAVFVGIAVPRRERQLEAASGWRLFLRVERDEHNTTSRGVVRSWWEGRLGYDRANGPLLSPPVPMPVSLDDLPPTLKITMLHRCGRHREAAALGIDSYRPPNALTAYNVACSLSRAGDEAAALSWLQRALADGWADAKLLGSDRDLKALRSRPEFASILAATHENARAAQP
ncbi:MAG: hypothetical protein R2726_10635 [Acidimicrobiales bacterium]